MIGVYDYTVIVTYLGLISSVFGMTQAIHGRFKIAICCLALSGLCDMLDGKIARTKKNRTEDERNFGIQLDSLCDVVCFGVFPAMIAYLLGMRGMLGLFIVFIYCICAVIRLAYFNVLEGKRQKEEGGKNKVYHGLPITSVSVLLPLAFLTQEFCSVFMFQIILHVVMLATGILFIVDFPFPKPGNLALAALVGIVAAAVLIMFVRSRFRIPPGTVDSNPILDMLIDDCGDTENTEM